MPGDYEVSPGEEKKSLATRQQWVKGEKYSSAHYSQKIFLCFF